MSTKEFVAFLRVWLVDKKKLTKSQVEHLKEMLDGTYCELAQDIVFRTCPEISVVEPKDVNPKRAWKNKYEMAKGSNSIYA